MLKQIVLLLLFLFFFQASYAASVNIEVDLDETETSFKYTISFNENESYNSFSFEKPRDAFLFQSKDNESNSIRFNSAGDFYIIRPEETEGKTFHIEFVSKEVSTSIQEKAAFSNYANFNFYIEALNYSINVDPDVGEVTEIFPRNYQIGPEGEIIWRLTEVEEDTLFLLNFEETEQQGFFASIYFYLVLGLIGIIVLMVITIFALIFWRRKSGKSKTKEIVQQEVAKQKETVSEKNNEQKLDEAEPTPKTESKVKEESFEEIINKYLTENEREVVEIVKEHNGISQYDILNFIPTLSKSNLSKIISKLHNKRFLNRIRVGKVNKIHLGEKLEDKE